MSEFPLYIRGHVFIIACCWLSIVSLNVSCAVISKPTQSITEISFSNGGGRMTYWYKFTLRKDGTAEYVGDVKPKSRGEARDGMILTGEANRVRYRGRVSAEQFSKLGELIVKHDFRSMPEEFPGYLDVPMTTTAVVFADRRKEVSDQMGVRGEGLAEINRAIDQVVEQIEWEQESDK